MGTPLAADQLSLVPLGAGDLIDRAVRLYRRYFTTLIRIAAPPVLISAVGSVLLTISNQSPSDRLSGMAVLMRLTGLLLWFGGVLLNVIVMGGAARNLITNLLWSEPFSARTTYRNVRARFWGLFGASLIIALWVFVAFVIAVLAIILALSVFVAAGFSAGSQPGWLASAVQLIGILVIAFFAIVLFFSMVRFIAYAPQVMMIEGRGVFDSIGRSFGLARGNLRRLLGMSLFYWFATWSALMILIIPLLWYGHVHGVDILPTKVETWPMWYAVGYSAITQASAILLAPVWMLGLSLMYVDERVRQEGYDIELIAARQLGAMPGTQPWTNEPRVTSNSVSQPSNHGIVASQYPSPGSTLGLK